MGFNIVNVNLPELKMDSKNLSTIINKWFGKILQIPAYLKWSVVCSLVLAACYFGYRKYENLKDMEYIKTEIETVKDRLDKSMTTDNYYYDREYIITAIKLLDEINYYAYDEQQVMLDILIQHYKEQHPNDIMIHHLLDIKRRNEIEFDLVHSYFENIFKYKLHTTINDSTLKSRRLY